MRFFALWIKYKYKIKMKKRICLSIVIVFCLTGIYAQEKKHSIGISITPQVNISNLRVKDVSDFQREGIGSALSENIYYQLEYKNMGFRIGLGYTNMNYTYRYLSRLSDYYVIDSITGLIEIEYKDRVERTVLNIPLSFFYDFYHRNRFSIGANAGIGIELFIKENRFFDNGITGWHTSLWRMPIPFFDRFNLSANVGIDFKWTFDNGLGLGITPTCSYFFTNMLSRRMISDNHREHYWLPGIACKAFYTFQKKDKQ
jgi:hypothetical protein